MTKIVRGEPRKLRRTNRQTMVALPAWVRRRLDGAAGDVVYWHGRRRGEVVLAAHAELPRGPAGRADLEEELRVAVAERDSLKQALTGHELGTHREVYAAGAMQGVRIAGPVTAQFDAIMRLLTRVLERVEQLPGSRVRRDRRAASPPRGPASAPPATSAE